MLSQDERVSQYAAYVTAATNIVANSGAASNVYLVKRKRPWGQNGTVWNFGSTELVSKGIGGPANGDSWSPSLSGTDFHNPKCMVFVSAASNLVRGDTNGRADVFHANLPSGKLTRFAGNAPVTEAVTEGSCEYFGYVAGGSLYLKRDGEKVKRIARGGVTNPHISVEGRVITYEKRRLDLRLRPGVPREAARSMRKVAQGTEPQRGLLRPLRRVLARRQHHAGRRSDQPAGPHRPVGRPRRGQGPRSRHDRRRRLGLVGRRRRTAGEHPRARPGPLRANGLAPGAVEQPDTSPHGNYAVFVCTNGPAYLLYEGPK